VFAHKPFLIKMALVQHHDGTFESADRLSLYEQSWSPQSPIASVVIVHGYAEHSTRYAETALHLAEQGFAVYSFDLRGHGKSGGNRCLVRSFDQHVFDLEHFIQRLHAEQTHPPLFLLGHSMGSAIVLLYALQHQASLQGVITSGTILDLDRTLSWWQPQALAWLSQLMPALPTQTIDRRDLARDPEVGKAYEADPLIYRGGIPARTASEMIRATHKLQSSLSSFTLPLLILHGTSDRIAPASGSQKLYEASRSSDKTLKLYDGSYHEILHEPERAEVLQDIIRWLKARSIN
jgi:acylglycerol lipase